MKLYTNAFSRGNTILPLIKELEIEDQVEIIEVEYQDLGQEQYLKLNPMGKVPFLVDGNIVISETPAIFAYLADKFIAKGFAPALDDPRRGEYLKWLFFCHGPLTEMMDFKSLNISPELINQKKTSLGFGTEALVYDFIKHGLVKAKPYLLGEKITAADLFFAYWMVFAISFKLIPYLDEFKPFLKLMKTRDSLKNVEWFQSI